MKIESSSKTVAGVGILAAIAASLCCITPLLALLAGASGAAASLSWLEPARPFLITIAIATLAFAWYRVLSNRKTVACALDGTCSVHKNNFLASKSFLFITTVAAVALMAFPYYADSFYPKGEKQSIAVEKDNIRTALFNVKGMTCKACEHEVNNELNKVAGVVTVETSYDKGHAVVKYDTTKANLDQLKNAIAQTGYKIVDHSLSNK